MDLRRFAPCCAILLFSLLSADVRAIEPYAKVLTELNNQLNQKNYATAYEYAEANAFDYAGEPDFDLLWGLASYGSGQFQQAVFAFERVVINVPTSYLGRYYLAQSYFRVNNLAAALVELDKLLLSSITSEQRTRTQQLHDKITDAIEQQRANWFHVVGIGASFDSNINSGTDLDTVEVPDIGEITLFDSAKATEDSGYNLNYQFGYRYKFNQSQSLQADLSAGYYGFAEYDEYQRQQLAFNLSFLQQFLGGEFSVGAYSKPLWLEQEVENASIEELTTESELETALYRTESGVSLFYQHDIGERFNYRIGGDFALVLNDINPELDFTRIKLLAALQYSGAIVHGLSLHWQRDTTDDSDFEYNNKDAVGLTYQFSMPLTKNLISSNYIMAETQEFELPHPLFQTERSETLVIASSQLLYRLTSSQQLKLFVTFQQKDSNVELFEYERVEAGGGWQIRF